MSYFISNEQKNNTLKQRLIELIKNSQELRFLVGFFYFSGIKELYEGLQHNPHVVLKVLVGLDIDILNYTIIEYPKKEHTSAQESEDEFMESVKKSINTEFFDTSECYEQIKFFIEMINTERLIIRKTYQPNHAKLYLFNLQEHQIARQKLFITGSSNLTRAGISTQNEFNIEIGDFGFDKAEEYFDNLWQNAVEITEFEQSKQRLIATLEKETLIKDVSPFEAFCLVLKTYLDTYEQREVGQSVIYALEKNSYKTYQYQIDAVKQALAIIENNNGVIIADVVGLGKTIIACCIAKQLKKRGVVICPPSLVGDDNKTYGWKKYIEEFGLYDWEVRSLGTLEEILKFSQNARDIEVVIVDEAHRFRNQDTQNYELLKNVCRGKHVVLLTATPFNNHPSDILSLLKLFVIPKDSFISFDNDLARQFQVFSWLYHRLAFIIKNHNSIDGNKRKKSKKYYTEIINHDEEIDTQFSNGDTIDLVMVKSKIRELSQKIRYIIEPVTIRRNRLDLQNNPEYNTEVAELSKLSDPQEWFFELTQEQSDFYDKVLKKYFAKLDNSGQFQGAIYRPFEYEKTFQDTSTLNQDDNRQFQQQRNLFDFMRLLLVKRFESSFGAFEQSIKNFKEISHVCLGFIKKTGEFILDRELLRNIHTLEIDEILLRLEEYEHRVRSGELPKNHQRYKIDTFADKEGFINDIYSDIRLFDEILQSLNDLRLVAQDPKADCLVKNIKKVLSAERSIGEPLRKVIIFSEYKDTVQYLESILNTYFSGHVLVVDGTLSASKIKEINKNFDAGYEDGQEDTYNILLTTDKISEGYNLNRAGMVINYDIPWNPVRVIQRVGRINRISKKVFEELHIVNFFPTEKGADHVRSREIAGVKMLLIHNTLGEDAKIFDIEEEPNPSNLFNRIQQNPDTLEQESFYTRALNTFSSIKKSHPELVQNLKHLPPRIKTARKGGKQELFVFFKKGGLFVVKSPVTKDKTNPQLCSFEEVFDTIMTKPNEKKLEWNTEEFWKTYTDIQNFQNTKILALKNDISLEQKALNKIDFLIAHKDIELEIFKNFLYMLKRDIISYGTLPNFTVRRISNFDQNKLADISALEQSLGKNYLDKEINRNKHKKKELIIAIEHKEG